MSFSGKHASSGWCVQHLDEYGSQDKVNQTRQGKYHLFWSSTCVSPTKGFYSQKETMSMISQTIISGAKLYHEVVQLIWEGFRTLVWATQHLSTCRMTLTVMYLMPPEVTLVLLLCCF